MDLGLTNRVALITGGSRGIGRAVALRFAEEGCNVCLVSRTEHSLQELQSTLRGKFKVRAEILAADLSQSSSIARVLATFPAIDVLVNNAGAIPRGTIAEIDEAKWREAWDLKVYGFINTCRAYLPKMAERRSGVIINIIGNAGEKLNANYIVGSAGNASLMAFTKTLGGVSVTDGVRVVGINPGPTATDRMIDRLRREAARTLDDAERWSELVASLPFGRAARPSEIAAAAAFLASDLSGYTSGTIFTIDGGLANRSE
jgi:NAD(P)-dependent dehydrogenase (short-subunit alcohol dehydrogenase family)